MSGFMVKETSATALTSVSWFAWADAGNYTGGGSFGGPSYNPGFEGVAHIAAVPEPATYSMMLSGLGLMGFMVSRKKSA